MPSREH